MAIRHNTVAMLLAVTDARMQWQPAGREGTRRGVLAPPALPRALRRLGRFKTFDRLWPRLSQGRNIEPLASGLREQNSIRSGNVASIPLRRFYLGAIVDLYARDRAVPAHFERVMSFHFGSHAAFPCRGLPGAVLKVVPD